MIRFRWMKKIFSSRNIKVLKKNCFKKKNKFQFKNSQVLPLHKVLDSYMKIYIKNKKFNTKNNKNNSKYTKNNSKITMKLCKTFSNNWCNL